LLAWLRTTSVHKVGVGIKGDLTRLFNGCGFRPSVHDPFVGALELGELAKQKNVTARANIGLADLCANVLQTYLSKDPAVRISERWNEVPLPESHANYAALDVYATWSIFHSLWTRESDSTVDGQTPGGTSIYLYSSDHSQPVAWGHIAMDRPKQLSGINVTKSRVCIVVRGVLVPGHIVSKDLLSTHRDTPLSEFPSPPYNLLCKVKYVRMQSEPDEQLLNRSSSQKSTLAPAGPASVQISSFS
jgi:hypothetical protein